MLKPEGRMEAFQKTMLRIWAQDHQVFSWPLQIGVDIAPWVIRMAAHNGVSMEDFATDALCSGSFILGAVGLGLRVGRTTDGHNWSGDLTPILSGPVTNVLTQDTVPVAVPIGVAEALQLGQYSPTAAAYYGMTIMRAAMERPVPGAQLVVAAVGDPRPGLPLTIHDGQSIVVPYMNPHGYQHF